MAIPSDIRLFLDEYPEQDDHLEANDNINFYRNETPSRPDGLLLIDIHRM